MKKKGTGKALVSKAAPKQEKVIGLAAKDATEARRKVLSPGFVWATCEEASFFSKERYIPCGNPAVAAVWHEKDRRAYQMCLGCADHNIRHRGGKLLAQKPVPADLSPVSVGLTMRISTVAVVAVKALQQERKTLEAKLELVKKDLKAQEPPIIAALEAGLPTEPGCPACAVDVEERITPGWKAEALLLAAAAGKNVEVYEAEIRAKTAPTVIKRLIINGREGK